MRRKENLNRAMMNREGNRTRDWLVPFLGPILVPRLVSMVPSCMGIWGLLKGTCAFIECNRGGGLCKSNPLIVISNNEQRATESRIFFEKFLYFELLVVCFRQWKKKEFEIQMKSAWRRFSVTYWSFIGS